MGRRGNGEGSIYRRKDRSWVAQYRVEVEGRVKKKYLYGRTRREVAAKLSKALSEREQGLIFDSGAISVEEFFGKWLRSLSLRASTVRRYESTCRVHIFPAVGKRRLDRLTPLHLQTLYGDLLASGLSVRSVQIVHATLHKGLGQAVKWSLVPRNVADYVDKPRYRRGDINPLTEEQVRVFLDEVRGDRLEALYVLAITTGLRRGEVLALRWDDVDLRSETLRIRRTLSEGGIVPPKTKTGRRNIRLGSRAVESLKRCPKSSMWVFPTHSGSPISGNSLYKYHFKPLLRRAGLPDVRFHDLRHTCATLLLSRGVHPKIVSEMLGHASISITLDTYSHVLPNMQDKAIEAMEDIISVEREAGDQLT